MHIKIRVVLKPNFLIFCYVRYVFFLTLNFVYLHNIYILKYLISKMLSSSLDTMQTLFKTTSLRKVVQVASCTVVNMIQLDQTTFWVNVVMHFSTHKPLEKLKFVN